VTGQIEPDELAAGLSHCVMCGWAIRPDAGRRRPAFWIPEDEHGEASEFVVYCSICFEREFGGGSDW
jgi:hypothetical protein